MYTLTLSYSTARVCSWMPTHTYLAIIIIYYISDFTSHQFSFTLYFSSTLTCHTVTHCIIILPFSSSNLPSYNCQTVINITILLLQTTAAGKSLFYKLQLGNNLGGSLSVWGRRRLNPDTCLPSCFLLYAISISLLHHLVIITSLHTPIKSYIFLYVRVLGIIYFQHTSILNSFNDASTSCLLSHFVAENNKVYMFQLFSLHVPLQLQTLFYVLLVWSLLLILAALWRWCYDFQLLSH